jgi:membrane-associated phospholipid phosphatase
MIFEEELSFSIIFLYLVPVFLYLKTNELSQLKGLFGMIGTVLFTESIKHLVIKKGSPRPTGANNCNLWGNDGNQEGKPGMPSGHSSQVSFFASYYFQKTNNIWIRSFLVLYAILVMISRYTKKCHTIYQIVTGSTIGILSSIFVVRYL